MVGWKYLLVAVLVIPAVLLLLFGPSSDSNLPKDRVIVDYWEKWTGDEASQLQEIVAEFNNTIGKEKGIYVNCVSTSNITQKTLISTAAGVPPDIAGVWDNTLTQLASMDALEPLDEMAAEYSRQHPELPPIDRTLYKKVYWDACNFDGRLVALISTPAAVALHYNTRLFAEHADLLRAAGLDPTRPPRTLDELDAYSKALTIRDDKGRLKLAGSLPLEPGWYVSNTVWWFGGDLYDEKTDKITLTTPQSIAAMKWIQKYSLEIGKDAMADFRSGLGNFDSPQNAFMSGTVAMEQQGPWMANFIRNRKPSMSFVKWKTLEEELKHPLIERRENYEWAAAAFPSAVPGLEDVTYAAFDALAIPRGAKHKKEAFEFIAYLQRQDVHEKLNMLHCKNSALARVSDNFFQNHPNPYIDVFERLAQPERPLPAEGADLAGGVGRTEQSRSACRAARSGA
ncbi:MAG: extracellular solute-binding protein [Tepidisphaeraceae bacterium]